MFINIFKFFVFTIEINEILKVSGIFPYETDETIITYLRKF